MEIGIKQYKRFDNCHQSSTYPKNREYLIKYLGNKCYICGSDKNLEFDHINHKNKTLDINKIIHRKFRNEVFEELKKCQLLCNACHTQKTIIDSGKKKAVHGTNTYYTDYKCRCKLCKEAARKKYLKYAYKKTLGF